MNINKAKNLFISIWKIVIFVTALIIAFSITAVFSTHWNVYIAAALILLVIDILLIRVLIIINDRITIYHAKHGSPFNLRELALEEIEKIQNYVKENEL